MMVCEEKEEEEDEERLACRIALVSCGCCNLFPSQTTHDRTAASNAIVHGVPVRFDGDHIAKVLGTFPPWSAVGRVIRCSVGHLQGSVKMLLLTKLGEWVAVGKATKAEFSCICLKMLYRAFIRGSVCLIPTCIPFSVDIPGAPVLHLYTTLDQVDVRGIKLDRWMSAVFGCREGGNKQGVWPV